MKILPLSNRNFYTDKREKPQNKVSFGSDTEEEVDNTLNLYLEDIKKYKRISRQREIELAKKLHGNPQEIQEARTALINANLRLVVNRARKRAGYSNVPIIDLIQEGNLGLYRATMDYNSKYAFSTHAVFWIDEYMKKAEYSKYSIIKLPQHTNAYLGKLNAEIMSLREKLGRTPTLSEISAKTKFTVKTIKYLMQLANGTVSLNDTIIDEKGKKKELIDTIPSNTKNPAEQANKKNMEDLSKKLLSCLSETTKQQMIYYFGLFDNPPLTLTEIAQMYKISYQAVQNKIKNAIMKIKTKNAKLLSELKKETIGGNS